MTGTPDSGSTEKNEDKGLVFFGAITASVSHELNNVISIIDQTAGLLQDLLAGARQGRPIAEERLQRIADSVAAQTDRGVQIIKRLNMFAHSVDDPVREFELNPTIENLVALTRRFASLKKAELETELPEPSIKITNSPFRIQQILFSCMRWFINSAKPGDKFTIRANTSDSNISLAVEGPLPEPGQTPELEHVQTLSRDCGGTVDFRATDGRAIFEITLPTTLGTGKP